jgi:cell division protein FtsL
MIRVVTVFCIGLLGLTCLSAYHVSEQTRVARQDLSRVERQIGSETQTISVLEAQWQKIANPAAIQRLAEASLGMQNAPSVQLASVQLLPRRGESGENEVRSISAEAATQPVPVVRAALRSGM